MSTEQTLQAEPARDYVTPAWRVVADTYAYILISPGQPGGNWAAVRRPAADVDTVYRGKAPGEVRVSGQTAWAALTAVQPLDGGFEASDATAALVAAATAAGYDVSWTAEQAAAVRHPAHPDQAPELTVVEDMVDMDLFTLDGRTWHRCGFVMFGTVSVYDCVPRGDDSDVFVRVNAERAAPVLVIRGTV